MKAAVLHKLGEAPRFADFADPVAGAEEALVRVRAASLKNIERRLAPEPTTPVHVNCRWCAAPTELEI
jgi:hypothetical protein